MKFVQYDLNRVGVLRGDRVVDITALLETVPWQHPHDPMQTLIAHFHLLKDRIAERAESEPGVPAAHVRFGPPLRRPGKIVAAPANYYTHVGEVATGSGRSIDHQGLFLLAPSSLIGPGQNIEIPFPDRRTDHECELAVVLGRDARRVREDHHSYIFGYTCLIDVTVRGTEDRGTRKSFDTFTPIGPCLVTADEIPDPQNLDLRLWVNEELRHSANTSGMIWNIPKLIEYASDVMTLHQGDMIATGTPGGVGPITPGDQVTIEVERVGRMTIGVTLRD